MNDLIRNRGDKLAAGNQAAELTINTGRNQTEELRATIFKGRSTIQRTPPPQSAVLSPNLANVDSILTSTATKSQAETVKTKESTMLKETEHALNSGAGKEMQLITKCRGVIDKMKLATSRQRNISNDVKLGLSELEELIDAIAFGIIDRNAPVAQTGRPNDSKHLEQTIEQGTTTPSGGKKRFASSPADQNEEKRVREVALLDGWQKEESRREKNQRKKHQKEVESQRGDSTNPKPVATAGTQERPKKRTMRARRDALLIKPAEGQTYAEVLKEIRSRVKPDEAEAEVTAIRQTKTGGVLIELGSSTKDKDGFRDLLNNTLGEKGTVVHLETKMTVEIRDLDSYTMKEEVVEALKREVPEAGEISVSLFPCAREQKVAVVVMSEKAALKLVNQGKVKVGWIVCRVRKRAMARRCFKCLGYGHVARNCDGPDRSKLCYKCLGADHKAKTCTVVGHCVLCEEKGLAQDELAHTPGTGKCKVYREALQEAKSRR